MSTCDARHDFEASPGDGNPGFVKVTEVGPRWGVITRYPADDHDLP